uniref:Major facilitator superfamily (MFS) profile domain-containing protein n=1 Tax=Vitis vinifera TaxID=29760 RepID=F6HU03_VITVI
MAFVITITTLVLYFRGSTKEQDPLPASTAQLDPPKILPDITDQTGGESDFLTPHKKLLHSINAVEKAMRKNWGNCREFQCKEGPERKKGYVNGSIDGVLFGIQGNEDGNNRTDKDQKKVELTTSLTEKMAAKQEVEKGNANITEPLIVQEKQGEAQIKSNNGGLRMVLLSIFVAVCGSFEFGSCYSVFGSILSIGAMIGAISSGWIADSIGRKGARAGYEREFKAELQKLRGVEADISEEEAEIQEYMVTHQLLPKVGIMVLLDKQNVRSVIVGVGLMVFQQFGGYNGIVFYADQIFVSAGVPPNLGGILYSSLQVIVTAFGASLIDRLGRRPLLMVSAFGLLLGCLLTGISFFLKAHQLAPNLVPILAVTGIMVHIGFYSVGLGPIPWLIMSEIFPLHVKAIAGSLVTLVNWFGAWAVSYTFNFLMNWSSHGTFFGYAFVCAAAIVFIIMVVPETKGQTLEEIQASMNR